MRAFFLAVSLLTGCGPGGKDGAYDDEAEAGGDNYDTGSTPAEDDTSTDGDVVPLPPPRWWTISAVLVLQDGLVQVDPKKPSSYLEIRLWDEAGLDTPDGDDEDTEQDPGLDTGDTGGGGDTGSPDTTGSPGGPLCVERFTALASATEAEPPHESVFAWWAIEPGESDDGCAALAEDLGGDPTAWAIPLQDTIYLGIGAMHEEVQPALSARGIDPSALNGAYAALEDPAEKLLVFGAAGTADAFAGDAVAATAAPLEDGSWTILPLYTFAYE